MFETRCHMYGPDFELILERVENSVTQDLSLPQVKLLINAIKWEAKLNALLNGKTIELEHGLYDSFFWEEGGLKLKIERQSLTRPDKTKVCDLKLQLFVPDRDAREHIRLQANRNWDISDIMDQMSYPIVYQSIYQPDGYVFSLSYENLPYGIYSIGHGFQAEKCLELQTA